MQDREFSVGALLSVMDCCGANVSQHLNILRCQGIIGSRKEANVIYNRIVDEGVVEMIAAMERIFCAED